MKTIFFKAQCRVSDKFYKKLTKDPIIVWDVRNAIGMIDKFPILITEASLEKE